MSKIGIIPDNPAKIDSLDFEEYRNALVDIIMSLDWNETPIVIGIHGKWGTGKTTLMQMIREELKTKVTEDRRIKSVWFNAWKYEKAEEQWAALIQVVLSTIENDKEIRSWVEGVKDEITEQLQSKGRKILRNCKRMAINLGKITAEGLLKKINVDAKLEDLLVDEKKVRIEKEKTVFQENIDIFTNLQKQFDTILEDYIGRNGKMVIFIDDLDRCLPEKAIEILEVMKIYLDTKGCIFIVGVDTEAIRNGIKAKYGSKEQVEGYLQKYYIEKIIQLPFQLPPLNQDNIRKYIKDLNAAEIEEYADEISLGIKLNPRKIKRFYNIFKLQKEIVEKRGLDIEDPVLVEFLIVQYSWSRFHDDLIEYKQDLIERMKEYIEMKKETGDSIHKLDEEVKEFHEKYHIWNVHFKNRSLIRFLKKTDFLNRLTRLEENELLGLITLSRIVSEEQLSWQKSTEDLIQDLKNKDNKLRQDAAYSLGKTKKETAVEPLIAALKDTEADVRWNAAFSLGKIGSPIAVDPLIEALEDEDSRVRTWSIISLGDIGIKRAVGPLIEILNRGNQDECMNAAYALEKIKDVDCVQPLKETLNHDNPEVRKWTVYLLGKIGEENAVKPLISVLDDKDPDVKRWAAIFLGKIGDPEAVNPLISILEDKDPEVRTGAANALGKIGDDEAVLPLIGTLKDPNTEVKKWSAISLGRIGDERAIEPLSALLQDETDEIKDSAKEAIEKIRAFEKN